MSAAPRIALDHDFADPGLLRQALTHRSYGTPNNERLEFVGDAVLELRRRAHALRALSRTPRRRAVARCARTSSTRTRLRRSRGASGSAAPFGSARARCEAAGPTARRSSPTRWRRCSARCSSTAGSRRRARDDRRRLRRPAARRRSGDARQGCRRRACRNGCRRGDRRCPNTRSSRRPARRTRSVSKSSAGFPSCASSPPAAARAGARRSRTRRSARSPPCGERADGYASTPDIVAVTSRSSGVRRSASPRC